MSTITEHAEWLSLLDISGSFLAEPVLKEVFPQGLEEIETSKRQMLRQAYDEWRDAQELEEPDLPLVHRAWIDLVLRQGLELDEDGTGDVFKAKKDLPDTIRCDVLERSVVLFPDYAVVNGGDGSQPSMLISVYEPGIALDEAIKADGWSASPADRMVELCRAAGVRLGLVTNGERWMLVDAPVGAVTSFASWYANLWGQEPKTLQAFVNLLGIRRFFVDSTQRLPALLDESLKLQDEVTDALGEQVRRAVEVLIQSFDRANVDRNDELLEGVEPTELYEAALTIMMRIVFLLSAEERGLLLMGDERYEANYAVSTLRMQLRGESEEILERRWDAWSRLLAIFRAVYGGIDHDTLRLPALGGSLFDPDKFPFLEGRAKGSCWKSDFATPLPIDNRTVLLLLDAVQLFQGRTLSYRALDVEQIGYVYEGLLERTVVRAEEVTLDLSATKNAKNPWVTIEQLEAAALVGAEAVSELLKERTGSSASRVTNDLAKSVDAADADKLLTACHGDLELRERVKPYFHFLRLDRWEYPLVYPVGTFMVTTGADRRETGTHYTPKSLTEAIVKETLEPAVYIGPKIGEPRENWKLRSPSELLGLKICDPAMGSGAFLVQVCRWLSERLVEAWEQAENAGKAVTALGLVVDNLEGHEPLREDAEERILTARRLVAERSLYGVDMNPLAVELAKLSIWLVTLAKGRPFGFLDHNLRSGDTLLGIHSLDQLIYLDINPGNGSSKALFASKLNLVVDEAIAIRARLRSQPIRDIRDVELMNRWNEEARQKLELPELIADALIGEVLQASGRKINITSLSIEAGRAIEGDESACRLLRNRAMKGLSTDLLAGRPPRKAFHWPLEFPEVFAGEGGGFDAVVGNPPFLGGKRIAGAMGRKYLNYLINTIGEGVKGSADLIAFFFLRTVQALKFDGVCGLIASNSISEGGTREVGLEKIRSKGCTIFHAVSGQVWPGAANVVTSQVHISKGRWSGSRVLDGKPVQSISAYLTDRENWEPVKIQGNRGIVHQGSVLLGKGFLLDSDFADGLISADPKYSDIIFPYLSGQDVNQNPRHESERWVVNFWDWSKEKSQKFSPNIFSILEKVVRAERLKMKSMGGASDTFWRHLWYRSELYHALGYGDLFSAHPAGWKPGSVSPKHVLTFATGATKYPCFTFVPNKFVFANTVCVILKSSFSLFACLSSDIHSVWAFEHGSRLHERLRYTHGDIFETFPFPDGVLSGDNATLADLGEKFFEARKHYMEKNQKGMTKFYNELHNPKSKDSQILICRDLQRQINDCVLTSYRVNDVNLDLGFHEVGYLPAGKNVRYTMSEEARIRILAWLAQLNKNRYEMEKELGLNESISASDIMPEGPFSEDLFSDEEGLEY